jgi:hypothetical protein
MFLLGRVNIRIADGHGSLRLRFHRANVRSVGGCIGIGRQQSRPLPLTSPCMDRLRRCRCPIVLGSSPEPVQPAKSRFREWHTFSVST